MSTITIVVLLLELGTKCFSQTTNSREQGIVMTVVDDAYRLSTSAHIRHLPKFPGYDNITDILQSTPGLQFSDQEYKFMSVDVDFRIKSAYLYNTNMRLIMIADGYTADLNITNMTFGVLYTGVSTGTTQLVVDWLSHTVYWTDSVYRYIMAAPGQKAGMNYHKRIVSDNLDAPAGLAIDPVDGFLFWSDNGKHPKIERSNLLGQERHTIVQKHIKKVNSMEVDRFAKRLFWLDWSTSSLSSCDYDGSDVLLITRISGGQLFDLAIFRDYVYISDNGVLISINKLTKVKMEEEIDLWPENIYGLAVYSEEIQRLKDTDSCAELNCDQLCFTTTTGAECHCSDGNTVNITSGKCEESYAITTVVFANTTHICTADIRSLAAFYYDPVCVFTVIEQSSQTAPPDAELIKMFDMNMLDRIIYYVTSDNRIYERPIDLPIEDSAKVLVVTSSGENITGIAYDAEDSYLYWTESNQTSGNIYRVDINQRGTNKVNPSNMLLNNPKDILVVLKQRKLVFSVGEIGNMSIQTLNMNGDELTYIAQAFYEVVSPTIDQESLIVYFLVPSKNAVYSVGISGTKNPTKMFFYTAASAYILLHYNNYMTWIYMLDGYAHAIVTSDYQQYNEIGNGYFDNATQMIDMKILDVKTQSLGKFSPCAHENGGCSHMCITSYANHIMTKQCECRLGYTLDDDEVSCKTGLTEDDFILASDTMNGEVIQFNLQTYQLNAMQITESAIVLGIYYDAEFERIIWAESYDSMIYTANLNGTGRHILAETGTTYAKRFAKDTSTGNVYYVGYGYPEIGFITPSGEIILLNNDFLWEELNAIAVHPGKGWLYYGVSDPGYSSITRCDMDGRNITQLITGDHVYQPSGLAIDYVNNHLYWSDYTFDKIERCNLDGNDCIIIIDMPDNSEHITDIATDGEFLYYSANMKDHLVRVSLTEPYTTLDISRNSGVGQLHTLSLYKSTNINIQPVTNACENRGGRGDCSTICVPTPSGRTCMCQEDISLTGDGVTCSDVRRCPLTIQNGTLAKSCTREIGEVCNFSCELGFSKTESDAQTICTGKAVWHAQTQELCSPYKCSASILHGGLESGCSRSVGDSCGVTCDDYYTPTSNSLQIRCQNDGWDVDIDGVCQVTRCPETIQDGSLLGTCEREIGKKCDFSCDVGFSKTADQTTCTIHEVWHATTDGICTPNKCSDSIKDGELESGCSRSVGDSCSVTCNENYTLASTNLQITCQNDGWDVDIDGVNIDGVCQASLVITAAQTSDGVSEGGVIAGSVLFLLIIIALIVVIVILLQRNSRKRTKSSNHGTASFHKDSDTAVLPRHESHRVSLSGSTLTPNAYSGERGYVNPAYGDGSLYGGSQGTMGSVLTYGSWMNDRQKDDRFAH